MLDKIEKAATPRRRKWAYGVTTAGLAVLGTYGVLTGDQVAAWLYLAAMVTGMAVANTDTTEPSTPRRAIEDDQEPEGGQ